MTSTTPCAHAPAAEDAGRRLGLMLDSVMSKAPLLPEDFLDVCVRDGRVEIDAKIAALNVDVVCGGSALDLSGVVEQSAAVRIELRVVDYELVEICSLSEEGFVSDDARRAFYDGLFSHLLGATWGAIMPSTSSFSATALPNESTFATTTL